MQLLECRTSGNFWNIGLVGKPSKLGCGGWLFPMLPGHCFLVYLPEWGYIMGNAQGAFEGKDLPLLGVGFSVKENQVACSHFPGPLGLPVAFERQPWQKADSVCLGTFDY